MKTLEFYLVCKLGSEATGRKKAVALVRPLSGLLSDTERRQSDQDTPQWPALPKRLGYPREVTSEHHVIAAGSNGGGVLLLCPHPVWNVGLS